MPLTREPETDVGLLSQKATVFEVLRPPLYRFNCSLVAALHYSSSCDMLYISAYQKLYLISRCAAPASYFPNQRILQSIDVCLWSAAVGVAC
jgi:hypothetical protein